MCKPQFKHLPYHGYNCKGRMVARLETLVFTIISNLSLPEAINFLFLILSESVYFSITTVSAVLSPLL